MYLAAGGSGGSRIFGGVDQTILNLDWGLDARQAVKYGRFDDQLYPTYLEIDEIYPPELITQLAERGQCYRLKYFCCKRFEEEWDSSRIWMKSQTCLEWGLMCCYRSPLYIAAHASLNMLFGRNNHVIPKVPPYDTNCSGDLVRRDGKYSLRLYYN